MTVRVSVRMHVLLESYFSPNKRRTHLFGVAYKSCELYIYYPLCVMYHTIFVRAKYPDTKRGMCGKIILFQVLNHP